MNSIFLCLLSSVLLLLSFPSFNLEFTAWFGLVPLLLALKKRSWKSAFGSCFLAGLMFFMGVFYWINIVKGFRIIEYLILGSFYAFFFSLFGMLYSLLSTTGFPSFLFAPVLWVSIEYLRSSAGFMALPWALLGHSQYLNLPIIQIASYTGVYGISFLIVAVNGAIATIIGHFFRKGQLVVDRHFPFKPVGVSFFLVVFSAIYGYSILQRPPGDHRMVITVIQANIPQEQRWVPKFFPANIEKHVRLSQEAHTRRKGELIVWPEGSVPGPLTGSYFKAPVTSVAKETGTPLLIGTSQRPKSGPPDIRKTKIFNSAFLLSPTGEALGQYNKIYLLPFAEFVPNIGIIPWPSYWASSGGNFIPGSKHTVFNLNGNKFGVAICWESIFPDIFRKFVKNGAELMINITNEAWFGETAAPYQFLSMNVFRAVENRISIARAANTGISCFINPHGLIIGRVTDKNKDVFVKGYLTEEVPLETEKTFYTIHGDVFAYLVISLGIAMVVLSIFKIFRGRSHEANVP